MDFQANRSEEEDRVMQRQLYRAGQNNQPAAKTPAAPTSGPFKPSSPPPAKAKSTPKSSNSKMHSGDRLLLMILLLGVGYYLLHGTPSQRKKTLIGIGVAVWLLMLGGISYCLFLPDLDALRHERRAIWEDKSLTFEQKKEKMEQLREKEKNLTPSQRKQMWEMDFKEMSRKRNREAYDFLKMTPEEQVAYLKKQAAERQKRFEEFRKMFADKGGGKSNRGNGKGNGGGTGNGKGNGGPGGGGPQWGGGGPPGGGWGGGGGGGNAAQAGRLDRSSPESRASGDYQRALSAQLGLGGGGRGGPGGGGGGGPRGGR